MTAMEHPDGGALRRAQLDGGGSVDASTSVEDHAVVLARGLARDEAAGHVAGHALGGAVERVAPAAATAGRQTHHVALAEHVAVRHRRQYPFVDASRIHHAAAWAPGLAAVHSRRREQ